MNKTIVVAIGGNSLISDPRHVTVPAQYEAAYATARNMASLIVSENRLAIVHGNGPQVGFILRRAEIAKNELHMVPLDSCVADTQGALGYNIQTAVRNVLGGLHQIRNVSTVVTEVVVDRDDPSFRAPTKPIGSFMDEKEARMHMKKDGWSVAEDAGRGWRRVVPSPRPVEILELDVIRQLVESGTITIAAGGGGIPVIRDDQDHYVGVEAVIDKDLAASLLARSLAADLFVISTAVEKVCLNFGKPDQKSLDEISVSEAKAYIEAGHFARGSMLPKIEAMVEFVEASGKSGIITDPEHLAEAIDGRGGTRIVPD
ncbi:carbamate kinase [Marispirochaeta aestuarii]|uniref:carbamate kinase n=1 Tax=Marispirochaeta aestuarii TaxID=1963862 RepID=UPI0029C7B6EC|nr:carbamate kinase [Marispirochaeta aestuarii]